MEEGNSGSKPNQRRGGRERRGPTKNRNEGEKRKEEDQNIAAKSGIEISRQKEQENVTNLTLAPGTRRTIRNEHPGFPGEKRMKLCSALPRTQEEEGRISSSNWGNNDYEGQRAHGELGQGGRGSGISR